MAIAFDASTDGGLNFSNSLSFAHTCSGSDRILLVAVFGDLITNAYDITSVTYNSVSLTEIAHVATPSDRWVGLYQLVAPATGSNNVVATVTGGVVAAACSSFTGVDQLSPIDSFNTDAEEAVAAFTAFTTVVAANCWLVMGGKNNVGATSAGTGTTLRQGPSSGIYIVDSNGTVATGSRFQEVAGGTAHWSGVIASLQPASTGSPWYYFSQQ